MDAPPAALTSWMHLLLLRCSKGNQAYNLPPSFLPCLPKEERSPYQHTCAEQDWHRCAINSPSMFNILLGIGLKGVKSRFNSFKTERARSTNSLHGGAKHALFPAALPQLHRALPLPLKFM